MRRISVVAIALVVLAGTAACTSQGGSSQSSTSGFVGSWVAKQPAQAGLTLKSDGTLTGNDGCNSLSGTWTESKKAAQFGPMTATKMACEGVDTWLSKATEARQDGETLNIYDSAGDAIGVLDLKPGG
jgi:heat shock protein HslJ